MMGMWDLVLSAILNLTDNSRDLLRSASPWTIAWTVARRFCYDRVELEGNILSPHHHWRDCSLQLLLFY